MLKIKRSNEVAGEALADEVGRGDRDVGHRRRRHLALQVAADGAGDARRLREPGNRLGRPDAAVLAGVEAQHVGGVVADHRQGVLRREDTFIRHDRQTALAANLGHRDMVAALGRLLEQRDLKLLEAPRRPHRLLDGVAAVGIHGQQRVRPDGLPDGLEPGHVQRGCSCRPTLTLIVVQPRFTIVAARCAATSAS